MTLKPLVPRNDSLHNSIPCLSRLPFNLRDQMTNAFAFIAKLVGRGVQSVMAERSRRRFESRGGCVSSRQVRGCPLFF